MRTYGHSFLTKPRWSTNDHERVTQSWSQWQADPDRPDWYRLSILGVINGILPKITWPLGIVLVVHHSDDTTEQISHYSLKRKWW